MKTTVFCYARLRDYASWRAGYTRAIAATPEVSSFRVWRGQDDPNYSITAEVFESRDIAERVYNSPKTREMMEADGIDMTTLRIEYVDEVA